MKFCFDNIECSHDLITTLKESILQSKTFHHKVGNSNILVNISF
jgi:hypothetical protein